MRLRIREHKGLHGPITLAGHDMKLGPRRHPRDRVLHPDPPAHRRRARPGAAGARHGRGAGARWRTRAGCRRTSAETLTAALPRPPRGRAPACRWCNDAQTHALPHNARGVRPAGRLHGPRHGRAAAPSCTARLDRGARADRGLLRARGMRRPRPRCRERSASSDDRRALAELSRAAVRAGAVEIFDRLRPDILARLARAGAARRRRCWPSTASSPGCPPGCSCSRCSRPTRS